MAWWSNLPSLTPLKGLGKFLYIWTHWEEISADLKKRDERLQAVEEVARQVVRLKEEAHEEEKRALERKLTKDLDKFRALTDSGLEVAKTAVARIRELQNEAAEVEEVLFESVRWLASDLHAKSAKERDAALSNMEPKLRKAVDVTLRKLEALDWVVLNAIRSEAEPDEQ